MQVYYPPNGVVPFHGFAMYAAPLCYVYNDPTTLYFAFRTIYTRYFYQLHTLSSHPHGIISLCLLFETLLQTHEPALFLHLKTIGVQPLRLAFKWLVRAFSGYLASEQVRCKNVIGPHRMHEMQTIVIDVRSVSLSRASTRLRCAKTAEQI